MRFQPKSEDEIGSSDLFPAGEYDFEVNEAEETTSKSSGADMVKLTIYIFNSAGQKRTVYDYLVGTDSAQFKVRGFAAATGLLPQYERGELDAIEMEGRTGRCKVGIQKDKTGQYPDKNVIASYIKAPDAEQPRRTSSIAKPQQQRGKIPAGADLDDEIPF